MKSIIKGFVGGVVAFLVIGLGGIVAILVFGMISETLAEAFEIASGLFWMITFSSLIGSLIAMKIYKPMIPWAISLSILTVSIFLLSSFTPLANFIFYIYSGCLGAFIAYLVKTSRKYRFFIMYAIPSFAYVPTFKNRKLLDRDAEEAFRMAKIPRQFLSTNILFSLGYSIFDTFKSSIWGSIVGAILGAVFGLLTMMIYGHIIREFLNINITPKDSRVAQEWELDKPPNLGEDRKSDR